MIRLVIHGTPRGKGRPRFNRKSGRAFTPEPTQSAEAEIKHAWTLAGHPHIDGPIRITIDLCFARPASHLTINGSLNAAGRRKPHPTIRPDWDNAAKLVADALNGLAYNDDSQIVAATVVKRWTKTAPCTIVDLEAIT